MPPERTLLDYLSRGQYQTSQDIPPMIGGPQMSQTEMLLALSSLNEMFNPPLPENVQAPTVSPYALDVEMAPLKAMGWLLGKTGGIKNILKHTKKTLGDLLGTSSRIDKDTATQLAKDVERNLPDVANIEKRADKLFHLEEGPGGIKSMKELLEDEDFLKFLDDPINLAQLGDLFGKGTSKEELLQQVKRAEDFIKIKNLRPGAGITEPYYKATLHTEHPGKTFEEVDPSSIEFSKPVAFEPIEIAPGLEEMDRAEELVNLHENLRLELDDFLTRQISLMNIDLDDEMAIEMAIRKLMPEFPHINKIYKTKVLLDELSKRETIRTKEFQTIQDMFEGKPY